MTSLRQRLRGVLGFPVTPFRQDLSLDLDALAQNVDEMAAHPFCALVAAGGTGELYSLTPEEVESVVRVTVDAAKGRMPVVAGAGYSAAIGADMARRAEKAGAECILALPPYYINAPLEGLIAYYGAIGSATALPLMVYSRDWAVFTPETTARLADRVPSLQFWKDGQGDARKYQRIMYALGDRLAWLGGLGDDCVPAYFAIGVQAYTSSISNIAPRAFARTGRSRYGARFPAPRCAHAQIRPTALRLPRTRQRLRSHGDESRHGDHRHARRTGASAAHALHRARSRRSARAHGSLCR